MQHERLVTWSSFGQNASRIFDPRPIKQAGECCFVLPLGDLGSPEMARNNLVTHHSCTWISGEDSKTWNWHTGHTGRCTCSNPMKLQNRPGGLRHSMAGKWAQIEGPLTLREAAKAHASAQDVRLHANHSLCGWQGGWAQQAKQLRTNSTNRKLHRAAYTGYND